MKISSTVSLLELVIWDLVHCMQSSRSTTSYDSIDERDEPEDLKENLDNYQIVFVDILNIF